MAIIQSVILGIIQGTTEFLPISSSAHLVLVPWLFGWDYNGLAFDTALHFGTAIAIVAFFWRDWVSIIARAITPKSQISNHLSTSLEAGKSQINSKPQTSNSHCEESATRQSISNETMKQWNNYPKQLLWMILVASIPAAIAGYFLSNYVETYLHSPILLAINLAVFGIILWLVDAYANRKSFDRHCEESATKQSIKKIATAEDSLAMTEKNNVAMSESASDSNEAMKQSNNELSLNKINYKQSLIVGLAQTLALVPGVSRSGITMTAARGLGLSRENSARFSFLLSTPAILGAFLFEARKMDWSNIPSGFWLAIFVTVIVSLLTIKYLLKYLQRGSFLVFTVYRIVLAIIIIALFLLR